MNDYAKAVEPYAAALRMIGDAIGELFGPMADLESDEAMLLRGPEPHHEAEAYIAALQRVRARLPARSAADIARAYVTGLDEAKASAQDRRLIEKAEGLDK